MDSILTVELITQVYAVGEKVVGAAVKYSDFITNISNETFMVIAKTRNMQGEKEAKERTIKRVYVNDQPELTEHPKKGKYAIIELDPDDANAGTMSFSLETFLNTRELDYEVVQRGPVLTEDGRVIEGDGGRIRYTGDIKPDTVRNFSSEKITVAGFTLNYRFYKPETKSLKNYPLVLFLHGAGERGEDNELQLLGNRGALVFADPEFQKEHPAFVIAPQVPSKTPINEGWTKKEIYNCVLAVIDQAVKNFPVDEKRIYITGVSMGGFGTWNFARQKPEIFAAALPICGGIADFSRKDVENLANLPIWTAHSADDPTVPVDATKEIVKALEEEGLFAVIKEYPGNLEPELAERKTEEMRELAKEKDSHLLFSIYKEGTTPGNPHWSWIPTYENRIIKEWLFSQRKSSPSNDFFC